MTTGPVDRAPGQGVAPGAQSSGEPRDGPPSSSSRKPDFCRLNRAHSGFNFFFMTQECLGWHGDATCQNLSSEPTNSHDRHTHLPSLTQQLAGAVAITSSRSLFNHSVLSEASRPHGLQPATILCSWDFPSKNTGVGCHFLLRGIFLTQGSNLHLQLWQVDSLLLSPTFSQI